MRNSEARQHKSFTPSISDILSRQNILIYHWQGPVKLSTQFMALSMGKKVNTYSSTLQGSIFKMQGGCELGLEKQMFSFRRQHEAEKLVKSSHSYEAMKSPEILSCPQDEQKTPSILYLPNLGAKCIILYNKLLQTEDFIKKPKKSDAWAYPITFEHHQYCRVNFKTHQTTCMTYCHLSNELSSVNPLSPFFAFTWQCFLTHCSACPLTTSTLLLFFT